MCERKRAWCGAGRACIIIFMTEAASFIVLPWFGQARGRFESESEAHRNILALRSWAEAVALQKAVKRRPYAKLELDPEDPSEFPCEACSVRKGGHVARCTLTLWGGSYDPVWASDAAFRAALKRDLLEQIEPED